MIKEKLAIPPPPPHPAPGAQNKWPTNLLFSYFHILMNSYSNNYQMSILMKNKSALYRVNTGLHHYQRMCRFSVNTEIWYLSLKLFTAIERKWIMDGNAPCSWKFCKNKTSASDSSHECGHWRFIHNCAPHFLLMTVNLIQATQSPGKKHFPVSCAWFWAEELESRRLRCLEWGPSPLVCGAAQR